MKQAIYRSNGVATTSLNLKKWVKIRFHVSNYSTVNTKFYWPQKVTLAVSNNTAHDQIFCSHINYITGHSTVQLSSYTNAEGSLHLLLLFFFFTHLNSMLVPSCPEQLLLVTQSWIVHSFQAKKTTKMKKKIMRMRKILMSSQRLLETDWKYLRISVWAKSTLSWVSSTLASILWRLNAGLKNAGFLCYKQRKPLAGSKTVFSLTYELSLPALSPCGPIAGK